MKSIRMMFLIFALILLFYQIIGCLLFGSTIPIIYYHNIGEPSVKDEARYFVRSSVFDFHLRCFKLLGFRSISISQFINYVKSGQNPGRCFIITFDDGPANNLKALPILQKYEYSATIFLISGTLIEGEFDIGFYTNEQPLTIVEVRKLLKENLEFGSHSRTHKNLKKMTLNEEMGAEIQGSKEDLERILKHPVCTFCYPNGAYSKDAKELVIQSGYEAAVTTKFGLNSNNIDMFELRRIEMKNPEEMSGRDCVKMLLLLLRLLLII